MGSVKMRYCAECNSEQPADGFTSVGRSRIVCASCTKKVRKLRRMTPEQRDRLRGRMDPPGLRITNHRSSAKG